ncbi:MAG: hypothetical protein D6733_06125 [Methanobacteriota archaeon]|nr:MAG: hypothetical protein D6733_06125 [Euryarchaeota archaeon]
MGVCEKCGEKYRKGDLFCGKCGARIPASEPAEKAKRPGPPKKEGTIELSEEVKRKVKAELEQALKAFKRGEISLEEFQSIKKDLVEKARSGAFDQSGAQAAEKVEKAAPPPPPSRPTAPGPSITPRPPPEPSGELYRPLRRADEPPFSKYWFIVPVLFNILGGVVAYFSIKGVDEENAKKMLAIGLVSLVVTAGAGGFYLKSQSLWPFEKKAEPPKEIVIAGVDEGDGSSLSESEPITPTNRTPAEMNLKAGDLGGGFYLDPLLSGTIKDPLEFAAGNSSLAEELERQGWLENHRIVLKKDFEAAGKNATLVEKEISSSISKYDANRTSKKYFEDRLRGLEAEMKGEGYKLIDLEINESGVMGKSVKPHPDYEVEVTYRVFFYKQDVFVSLSVSKIGRGLDEAEVKGYAETIESRIK